MLNKKIIGILVLLLAYYINSKFGAVKKPVGIVAETMGGSVRGIISVSRDGREFYEWLGIPYAKPPVGSLRFANPEPLDSKWDGVREANSYGSACAQIDLGFGSILGAEDCLFLNVFVPKTLKDSKTLLPVMFFIHGGSFMSGSADQFKPNYFMDEDVVLVTINYRLGALGFLSTGDHIARGNMGLKDQSLALRWVRDNIVAFGGDPKRVTIFGQSAGSGAVHLQMLSPMSRGLINRAISQSGSALNMWAINDDPLGQAKNFAKKLNCTVEYSTEIVKCLRNTELNALLEVHREAAELTRTKATLFLPVVEAFLDEETFLGHLPSYIFASRQFDKIPWLAGFNKDEGLGLTINIMKNEDFRKSLETDWNLMDDVNIFLSKNEKRFNDKIREFYFGKDPNLNLLQNLDAATNLCTDRWFSYGMYKAAIAHSHHAPAHFYFYNKTGPSVVDIFMMIDKKLPLLVELFIGFTKRWFSTTILRNTPTTYGVCHGDEIAMLFEAIDLFSIPKGDPHYEFSKDLVKAWSSFASESNADQAKFRGVKFPRVSPMEENLKVLEICDEPRIIDFPILDRMRFWKSIDIY